MNIEAVTYDEIKSVVNEIHNSLAEMKEILVSFHVPNPQNVLDVIENSAKREIAKQIETVKQGKKIMADKKYKRDKATCKQCGWEWFPRFDLDEINICPKCKSESWNKKIATIIEAVIKESFMGQEFHNYTPGTTSVMRDRADRSSYDHDKWDKIEKAVKERKEKQSESSSSSSSSK